MTSTGRTLANGTVITAAVSEEEIMAKCTPRSIAAGTTAWTAKQLAEWGVPWPPPAGWKDALIANYLDQGGVSAPAPTRPAEPVFRPMLPPHFEQGDRDFSTMDSVLKARWIQIIGAAKCREDAIALLCVPRRLMNDFVEQWMPDHKWPDTRSVEERRAAFKQRQEKRRHQNYEEGEA